VVSKRDNAEFRCKARSMESLRDHDRDKKDSGVMCAVSLRDHAVLAIS
jgi:hypothetical protein